MRFIGEHTAKLDDRGRLIFPSEFRVLANTLAAKYVVRRDIYKDDRLEMYPMEEWEKYAEEVKARLNIHTEEGSDMWEQFNSDRAVIMPDEQMGRITIPKHLLEEIQVQKEVVFKGVNNKIQIMSKEARERERSAANRKEFAKTFDKLMRKQE
ncbi:MAG: hypothetical protein FWH23_05410 [Bacteroidales bacterium]|nr:hypothetical protein [Bacteroidales bacterium]MCL2133226.1 hypothetical protein [Bacteroidales bacterium]MCL2133588.1 hypothetical protein [Bacteroidales bacterium]